MRILFVHESFGALGGAESNIRATANALKAAGHTVGLLHGPSTGKGEAAWRNTFQERFPFGQRSEAVTVHAVCEKFQPDVIYVHKLSDLELLEELLDSETPIIRMVHDHDLYCMRSYKYNFITRQICERALSPYCIFPCGACVARDHDGIVPLKWVSYTAKVRELELNRQCRRLVVATEFMKGELLRNQFDPDKIEIHAPVPPSGDVTWRSSFSDRNCIVYAGQIIRGKGVDVLLESLAKVRSPFTCFIFGDGNHRAYCEKLNHKLGLTDRVFFKGFVSPDEIANFYRECSVAVVSSVWPEPFGAVGLEAMRFGLPVVAFDAGGIREWLTDGHNGFLVPWMDRTAFAARVEQLLGDKTLARQMGERGRQLVAEQYAFSDYISGLENLFERVVAQPALLENGMNTETPPNLIALVGGSGAGKSWLTARLCQEFGDDATSLSLDDFYRDLSALKPSEREKVNFDHPDAIDWPLFEAVLRELQSGVTALAPRYDFSSHTRLASGEWRSPRPLIFVEGLWLLWHPPVQALFDLRVYLDCIQTVRWERRLARDLSERGRTTESIREQFWNVVASMHERYVEVQKSRADVVIEASITRIQLDRLVTTIRTLPSKPSPAPLQILATRTTTPQIAAHQSL